MKIYGISGLGADQRVFQELKLSTRLETLPWVIPNKKETLPCYAERMCSQIDQTEDFIILGVSFGGLVAVEMSKILKPKLTILVSSLETKNELKPIFSFLNKTKLGNILPKQLFVPPNRLAYHLFGTNKREMLANILRDTDRAFSKWAVNAMLNWKNEEKIYPLLKINGAKDKLMKGTIDSNTIVIDKGEHFMIVDKSTAISKIINERIKELN